MECDKRKHGIINETPSILLFDYETLCGSSAIDELPEEFMLPKDRIPTCRNQYTTGQCTAFATAGILEILNYLETGERTLFSTTYIYGRHRKSSLRTTEGMHVSSLMKYLTLLGSIPNDMMPEIYENPDAYDLVHGKNIEELDRIAQKTHIASYIHLKDFRGDIDKSIRNIKQALIKYQIPVFGDIKMDGAGHAICIVGWDKRYIYYMNSWGTTYGNKGICKFKPEKLRNAYLLLDAKNAPAFPFVDVPENHWAYHAISRCYSAGIINGVQSDRFASDSVLTKAHVAQALYKYAQKWATFNGEEFIDAENCIKFNDVSPEEWFYRAINYCVCKGVFDETSDMFKPNDSISRSEFCKVFYAFLRTHCSGSRMNKILFADSQDVPFIDVSKSDKGYEAISKCYAMGIINGVSETEFKPDESLTRAHLCQMVYKSIKLLEEYETN